MKTVWEKAIKAERQGPPMSTDVKDYNQIESATDELKEFWQNTPFLESHFPIRFSDSVVFQYPTPFLCAKCHAPIQSQRIKGSVLRDFPNVADIRAQGICVLCNTVTSFRFRYYSDGRIVSLNGNRWEETWLQETNLQGKNRSRGIKKYSRVIHQTLSGLGICLIALRMLHVPGNLSLLDFLAGGVIMSCGVWLLSEPFRKR